MKHAVLFLFLLTACASATQDDPNAPNVVLHLAQYESAPNAYLYGGPVNVRYDLSIANRTKDPITLNRIEIRTVSSGAYTIRPTSTPLNIDLSPGQEKTVPLSLWASAVLASSGNVATPMLTRMLNSSGSLPLGASSRRALKR